MALVAKTAKRLSCGKMSAAAFNKKTTARAVVQALKIDGSGKTAIVTGANSGIGKATAIALAAAGFRVGVLCRSLGKAEAAIRDIKEAAGSDRLFPGVLDLASLQSVRDFARTFLASADNGGGLHVLVNNAGIMQLPQWRGSEEGYELQFAVNYLGGYLLTRELLPALQQAATAGQPARVVNVSSSAHYSANLETFDASQLPIPKERYGSGWNAYATSKMLQVLHAQELSRRYANDNDHPIIAFAIHPGVIATGLGRNAKCCSITWCLYCASPIALCLGIHKSIAAGAAPSVRCAVDPALGPSAAGTFFSDNCQPKAPRLPSNSQQVASALFTRSDELCDGGAVANA